MMAHRTSWSVCTVLVLSSCLATACAAYRRYGRPQGSAAGGVGAAAVPDTNGFFFGRRGLAMNPNVNNLLFGKRSAGTEDGDGDDLSAGGGRWRHLANAEGNVP
jgi:hypothetical protein